ncbi:hypothetical protein LOTGIDRAFT_232051 [Lottia gigantea]|uniref:Uncharacterized protein n=1 Tax=Lottia gigantea TaxID=225164 RepID=V4C1P5_LOTGI|nr:hypothetical protein LOTGIDRAFT_232051 [Lottia gigantea]ESO95359.1 hypothetical protein LOTGIDRAFT_232051 [Lottia gigantea]
MQIVADKLDFNLYLNDIVTEANPKSKNKPVLRRRKELAIITTSLNTFGGRANTTPVKMVPIQISETVSVVQLPNYEERTVSSSVDILSMQRYNEKVNLEPSLAPVHFADTMICYKDSTRKRFVSKTYYEPRVKPRQFSNTIFIYPKRPEKSFVSLLDYHMDECRQWFKTCVEFKAKTYTTTKVDILNNNKENLLVNGLSVDSVKPGPGATSMLLPLYPPKKDSFDDEMEVKVHLKHPDINMNDRIQVKGY